MGGIYKIRRSVEGRILLLLCGRRNKWILVVHRIELEVGQKHIGASVWQPQPREMLQQQIWMEVPHSMTSNTRRSFFLYIE